MEGFTSLAIASWEVFPGGELARVAQLLLAFNKPAPDTIRSSQLGSSWGIGNIIESSFLPCSWRTFPFRGEVSPLPFILLIFSAAAPRAHFPYLHTP